MAKRAIVLFLIVLVSASQKGKPLRAEGLHTFEAGMNGYYIHYKEDLPPGKKSTESGYIPSLYAGYNYHGINTPIAFRAFLDYSQPLTHTYAHTDYDGTTQAGTPLKATTNNRLITGEMTPGLILTRPSTSVIMIQPYAGLGYRYWYRGLGDGGSYSEIYTWYYVPVGVRMDYYCNDRLSFGLDLAGKYIFNGKIKVLLSEIDPGYNDPEGTLGNKYGYRIAGTVRYRIGVNWALSVSPWYEYYLIGKGNTFDITYYDSPYGTGYEPASTTRQAGILFAVQFIF